MRRPRRTGVAGFTGGMITGLTALALSACAPDELTTGPEATRQEDLPVAFDHGTFPTSTGIYRIPYVDGFPVTVGNDHHDHNPVNRIDMSGDVGGGVIVAAASGWIRGIVDRHGNSSSRGDGLSADGSTPHFDNLEHACQDDDVVVGDCTDYNNYVWIEHPNGEWTKYTHLSTGSVPNAYQVGDWVDAGDVLGTESDIGRATGPHLHHEVGLPDDPGDLTPFTELGGFMVGGFGINLVPRVCDIPDNLYESDESYTAGPCANVPPVANAGGPYTVAEGSTVQLDGTGSFDPDGLPLTFAWSPGRYLDDRLVASPIFNGEDDAVVDLDLTVYDQVEAIPAGDETTVTVTNVDPSVTIDASTSTTINEGQTLAVKATFSDPGLLDAPFTAEVVCRDVTGYGLTVDGTVSSVVVGASAITGAVDASCPFGDTSQSGNPPSGTFEVTVRVTDKDEGTGEASFDLTVLNVAPTPTIAMTGATSVNGMSTFLTQVGQPLDLSGNVTDPGSDDLFLTWDWDDGSVDNAGYRLLQLVPDPFPSPTSNPRNVTDPQSHVWSGACFYEISLSATDDDGGSSQDDANVIITGNSGRARGVGYWLTQYRGNRSKDFDQATLGCFLSITEYMSAVFNEVRAGTGSAAEAVDVLFVAGDMGDMSLLLDQQLLGVWLNFANGAFSWDDVVDTTGDGVPDTTLSAAVSAAEATRLDAGATRDALEAQMKALEAINLMHGG